MFNVSRINTEGRHLGTMERQMIRAGEAQMTKEFGVSRTVIREAVASLRANGLVAPRQGAGVFVHAPPAPVELPFQNTDFVRISSMIELLELRTAVEAEAAALAAQRRSPAQEEKLIGCLRKVDRAAAAGEPTMEADFALHLAIAEATNNPRFGDFLSMIGSSLIPRKALSDSSSEPAPKGIPRSHSERARGHRERHPRRRRGGCARRHAPSSQEQPGALSRTAAGR